LAPALTVITNIDREHLDYYPGIAEIRQAFVYFANRVPFYGVSLLCVDDPEVREILPQVTKRSILYGTRAEADVRAEAVTLLPHGSNFTVVAQGQRQGVVELKIPGRHNVLNALAAVGVGLEVEVGFAHIAEALAGFRGVSRRFETRGEAAGVRVVDDYGHHPTEIAATLAAARGLGGRVLVIFQPHRFTRTQALREEFAHCFGDATRVWMLDIYAAGETPIPGVTASSLVDAAHAACANQVVWAEDPAAAVSEVVQLARPGDIVLTLGAGDVWKLGDDVLRALGSHLGVAGGRR
jgi:UDP-N-acetylmuramate--alanine ligase